jgi:hypothetical protein
MFDKNEGQSKDHSSERAVCMPPGKPPPDPEPDESQAPAGADPLEDLQGWAAYLASWESEEAPSDAELYPDMYPGPDDPPPEGETEDDIIAARAIAVEQAAAEEHIARLGLTAAMAADAAAIGRRGPGMPGSAHQLPGVYTGPAGGFATGQPLDVAPGGPALLGLAEYAAGDDDRFTGSSDDELLGVISALDRAEATACSLKHAAVAALIRRRPASDATAQGPAQMPESWDEFTENEMSWALAETRDQAARMLTLAWSLEVKLPGTKAAFRTGVLRQRKAEIISRATEMLDAEEARAAEDLVLGRAGRMSPGGLRAAIAQAVIQVAPAKAQRRRERAAKDARVQRWREDSGNAALLGRELPPAEVLAADQRISWWARQLKDAGLTGTMDELRARAYLDLLLDKDSRPGAPSNPAANRAPGTDANGDRQPGGDDAGQEGGDAGQEGGDAGQGCGETPSAGPPAPPPSPAQPGNSVIPTGFIGRNHLTIPLVTLLGLAERPGDIQGLGPADPALARDLARASAGNPKTTWCFTVTDELGHAIGHGCARPEPGKRQKTRRAQGHDPPPAAGRTDEPGFSFTLAGGSGPPGGYGRWRFSTGVPGQPDLIIAIEPIATDTCDHRFEARGHDPGVKLRHLSQIRHATCTAPMCRRPSTRSDFEHNVPYEAGGRTCLCNGAPKCRHEHRLKQHSRWNVEQVTPGTFRWTAPSGRQYTTEPARYPI